LAVSQDLDDPRGTSATIGNLGSICRQQGDFVAARTFLEQSLAIHRTIGDRSSEGRTLTHLGELALDLEEYGTAEQLVGEAIQLLRDLREEHYAADALVVLGQIYRRQGRVDLAVASWQAALPIYEAAHEAPAVAEVQSYLQAAAVK
jgi:tetratricopeptide (TPR) repeat protein